MTGTVIVADTGRTAGATLPAQLERMALRVRKAETSAELLDVRDGCAAVYDQAKRAARLAAARGAHDDIVATMHRAQADALDIESQAKRRLADEYDAAQERGEVAGHGGGRNFKVPEGNVEPTTSDLGLTRKQIHEARQVRDAEAADPGVVRRTVDAALAAGRAPRCSYAARAA